MPDEQREFAERLARLETRVEIYVDGAQKRLDKAEGFIDSAKTKLVVGSVLAGLTVVVLAAFLGSAWWWVIPQAVHKAIGVETARETVKQVTTLRDEASRILADLRARKLIRIYAGQTDPGKTAWTWANANAVYTDISTAGAEFTTTPVYLAEVGSNGAPSDVYTTIYEPTAKGFRLNVGSNVPFDANLAGWKGTKPYVRWIGIETTSAAGQDQKDRARAGQ